MGQKTPLAWLPLHFHTLSLFCCVVHVPWNKLCLDSWVMLACTRSQSTSGSDHYIILNWYICPFYLLLSSNMVNLELLLKRTPNCYGLEHIYCLCNTWLWQVLNLRLPPVIRMLTVMFTGTSVCVHVTHCLGCCLAY